MSTCQICAGPIKRCERFSPHPFLECTDCTFIFRPDLEAASLTATYADGYYEERHAQDYLRDFASRCRDAQVRLRYLRKWTSAGKLLDVGTAAGAFVREASTQGFAARGLEPAPGFVSMAERLGVPVSRGTLADSPLLDDRYDAITLWHVLEHLPDPVAQLGRIAGALSDGAVVAIEVPNAGSAVAHRMGSSWTSLQPEVHVNQFGPRSLHAALSCAGLQILDLSTSTITPYLTFRDRLGLRHLAARTKASAWLRSPYATHPTGHELLRAVARRVG